MTPPEATIQSEMRLSKSKILQYMNCPFQFKLQHINSIPYPVGPPAHKGTDFHDIMFRFYDRLNYEDMEPSQFKPILEKMCVGEIPNTNGMKREDEYPVFIENFVKFETDRFNRLPKQHYRPKHREIKIELGNWLSGIIDRCDYEPKLGQYILWDYKTGNVYNIKKHLFELCLYGYLFWKGLGKIPAKIGVLSLKSGNTLQTEISAETMIQATKIVNFVHQKIKNDEFDVNVNANCWFCPKNMRKICMEIWGDQSPLLKFNKGE